MTRPLGIAPPTPGWRYWLDLGCASVLGANLGDALSRPLGLGYWRGLPVIALLFGGVVLAARRAPRTTAWYWLAIILVRAAATNLSDWQILTPGEPPAVRAPWSFPVVIALWGLALAGLAWRDRRRTPGEPRADTDAWFWATMLVAGTLGTATGDWLGFGSGLGLPRAVALSSVALALALGLLAGLAGRQPLAFWALVALVRNWGTNIGDLLADTIGLWQGLTLSAVATGVVLFLWGAPRAGRTPGASTAKI